jgi:predicted transposase YbfD/YdcC
MRILYDPPLESGAMRYDAMGCQVAIADKIVEHKADYLLALKGNQPTLEAEVTDYFSSAQAEELVSKDAEIEKGHGRIEMRTYTASSKVDWIVSERSYPGEPRFTNIKTLVKVFSRTEYARSMHVRNALLHLIGRSRHRQARQWSARSLGRREHALAARR